MEISKGHVTLLLLLCSLGMLHFFLVDFGAIRHRELMHGSWNTEEEINHMKPNLTNIQRRDKYETRVCPALKKMDKVQE